MIEKWNKDVNINDEVYCLGDFSLGKPGVTIEILRQLNGKIHLIKGNHDHWVNSDTILYLESVQNYKELKHDKKTVVMFHYPIYEWNKMHYGSYHLYGHVHGRTKIPGRAMDVGIDARKEGDLGLFHWDEIVQTLENRKIREHN